MRLLPPPPPSSTEYFGKAHQNCFRQLPCAPAPGQTGTCARIHTTRAHTHPLHLAYHLDRCCNWLKEILVALRERSFLWPFPSFHVQKTPKTGAFNLQCLRNYVHCTSPRARFGKLSTRKRDIPGTRKQQQTGSLANGPRTRKTIAPRLPPINLLHSQLFVIGLTTSISRAPAPPSPGTLLAILIWTPPALWTGPPHLPRAAGQNELPPCSEREARNQPMEGVAWL